MGFSQIETNIGINLNDATQIRFTDTDIKTSLQDAYDDICALSQCIIKKVTLNWPSDLSYYDFKNDAQFGPVSDFMAVTAIFNNASKRWLQDDLSLSQFDKLRTYWEIWYGTPNWWAFASLAKCAVVPRMLVGTGTFDLYYWATAPLITSSDTPLVASDMQKLFEQYTTADLLDTVNEYTKASLWRADYYTLLEDYIDRTKVLCRSDLRLLI